ncbi:allantoin, partial [Aureobasidium melanogenum]
MGKLSIPSKAEVAAPFQSKEAFLDFLKAPEGNEGHALVGDSRWSNKDLAPTPVKDRTWTWYNLPLYWFSSQFSIVGWNTGSSLVTVGLTWQQSFISACIGSFLASVIVVLMARPGAKYHIGYPVLARSVMGMYGSYFFVFIRAMVCIVWYGIQTFYAGNVLSVMFRCIFGHSWNNLDNTLPLSANVSSKQLLAFFIAWLIQFPFMWVHPKNIHYIFTIKGFTMPVAAFALFGCAMSMGAGLGDMDIASKAGELSSSVTPLGWSIMSGINTIFGGLSPMLVNQPDLARYCKKPRDAGLLQGLCVFFPTVLVFFLGLASTTSIQIKWGTAYWNVWDLLDVILDHHFSAGARTGIFFIALVFFFGVFVTNIGANSLPFGADMTGLIPKFLTIRRGQILCAILGVVVQPWQLMANASAFLSFLGSYNIFMAPLCAIIIVDYFVIRKGNLHVRSCFTGSKSGLYWYWSGVNIVGVVAWLLGTTMGIPGLIGQYQPEIISLAAKNMYRLGYILTFTTAATVYYVLRMFIKPRIFPIGREDTPLQWEWLANEGREGFYEDEKQGNELFAPATPPAIEAEEIQMSGKAVPRRNRPICLESGKRTKRTAAGIPTWSPTVVLICRSTAYVWQSGRDAQFSVDCGRGTFDASKSSTFQVVAPAAFNVSFADGSTDTGDLISDVVQIRDLVITDVTLGLAHNVNPNTGIQTGLLGLGYSVNEGDALTSAWYVAQTVFNRIVGLTGFVYSPDLGLAIRTCADISNTIAFDFQFGGWRGVTGVPHTDPSGKQYCALEVLPAKSSFNGVWGDSIMRAGYFVYDLDNGQVSIGQARYSDQSNIVAVQAGLHGLANAINQPQYAQTAQTYPPAPFATAFSREASVYTTNNTIGVATASTAIGFGSLRSSSLAYTNSTSRTTYTSISSAGSSTLDYSDSSAAPSSTSSRASISESLSITDSWYSNATPSVDEVAFLKARVAELQAKLDICGCHY